MPNDNNNAPKSVLLVVDDESSVCRAISRMLRRTVQEVVTATSPAEAQTVLNSRPDITLLICDHWLGPGQPFGVDLVRRWRQEHPQIERAIVLTGADVTRIDRPAEVDAILAKTSDPSDLSNALFGGDIPVSSE